MRSLSAVAFLLGISAACSSQPAGTGPPPTGAESKPAAGVPASPPASTPPRPFTQSPWSPGAQTPEMWGQDPVAGTNEGVPRQRQ
jgi:hypothetical protein